MREIFYKILFSISFFAITATIGLQAQHDVSVSRNYVEEYTMVPITQTPHSVEAIGENVGVDPVTGAIITTTISDPIGGTVFIESSTPQNLAPGETFSFEWPGGGFAAPYPAVWEIEHSITINETDVNPGNNSVPILAQEFSALLYSRDDFFSTFAYGIGAGTEGSIGNEFDIVKRSAIKGVQIQLGNPNGGPFGNGAIPTLGANYTVAIWDFDSTNMVPGQIIAESETQTVQSTALGQVIDVPLSDYAILDEGVYIATIEEPASNPIVAIGKADNIFINDRIWICFSGSPFNINGGWSHTAPFPAQFVGTPMVRMNTACMYIDAGQDSTICLNEAVTLGGDPTTDVTEGPVTYSWSPATDLDDPNSANPVFSPSTIGTHTYTLVASDTVCSDTATVTINVLEIPEAGIAGLETDYCVYEQPDTIDYQPLGLGQIVGPGTFKLRDGSGSLVYDTTVVYEDTFVNEDFESCELPMGWSTNMVVGSADWAFDGNTPIPPTWPTCAAVFDDDGAGIGTSNTVELLSPVIDLGGADDVRLNFEYVLVSLAGESVSVEVYDGNSWVQVFQQVGNMTAIDDETVDVTPFGNEDFQLKFIYDDGGGGTWGWHGGFDNIKLFGTTHPAFRMFSPELAGPGTHDIMYCVDNGSCVTCDTARVNVHPRPDAGIQDPGQVCSNETVTLVPNTPNGVFSGPGIVVDSAGIFDASLVGVGTTTVYYEVIDANGCYNRDSLDIEIIAAPIADAGPDLSVCRGEEIIIGGDPTGEPGNSQPFPFLDNYQWSPATGLSSSVDPNPAASPDQTTEYIVAVTDNNGCVTRDTMVLEVEEKPVADAGENKVSCDGAPVIIGGQPSASGGVVPYSYSWEPASGLSDPNNPNPQADPSVTTNYTLTVTGANGCEDTDEVIVSVKPSPYADAGSDLTVCSDEEVQLGGAPTGLSGTPPYTYSWNPTANLNSGQVANPTFTFTNTNANPVTKVFTVTVTDASGCASTDEIAVTVRPAVFVDAGLDTAICTGESVKLGGVAPATNGIPPYNYNWGPTVGITTPNVAKPVASPTSSTIYTLTVTDGVGCVGEDEVEVIVNELPVVNAGPDREICYGDVVTIGGEPTANHGQAPYDYEWSPYIGLNDETLPNPTAGPNSETNFTVTVTDANGCQNVDVMTVSVNENPQAHAGVDKQICIGESIEIGAKPAASNGTGPYHYNWTPIGSLNDEQVENPIASPTTTTKYYLTVTDMNECTDVDTMQVTVNELPDVSIVGLDTDFCFDDSIQVLQGDPQGGVFSGNGVFGSTFIPAVAGAGQHDIKYVYTDENGCTDSTFQIIEVHGLPFVDAGPDKFIYLSQNTVLEASSDGNYVYVWTPDNNLSNPTVLNPEVIGLEATTTYVIEATNQWGCSNEDEVTVVVDVNLPIDPPNLFTPNGDGVNDTWYIEELAFFPDNNLKVFNRYGQLVYEADNVGPNAWDGGDMPEGTYYWVLTLDVQGSTVHRGTVTIKR